jgi:16S rRNA (uracil1498-N3)-methyltransferase
MSAFYFPFDFTKDDIIKIVGDEFKHIKVQRKLSNELKITNGLGKLAITDVIDVQKDYISLKVKEIIENNNESSKHITLFFGLIDDKNRIEYLIEKATELGVISIYPVFCKNSQFKKFDIKRAIKKSIAAIKQSERSLLPEINEIIDFNSMLSMFDKYELNILADMNGNDSIENKNNISICVGPEGGFTADELAKLNKITTSLKVGNSVLRTETATIALISKII